MLQQPQSQGIDKYLGKDLVSSEGEKLGTVESYLDDRLTEVPTWILVTSGLLATRRFIVPLAGSEFEDDHIRAAYSLQVLTQEPEIDSEELNPESEAILQSYFGLGTSTEAPLSLRPERIKEVRGCRQDAILDCCRLVASSKRGSLDDRKLKLRE